MQFGFRGRLRATLWVVPALATLVACGGSARRAPGVASTAGAGGSPPGIVDLMDPTQPIPPERFLRSTRTSIIPGDELEIRTYDNVELSGIFLVPPDGRINLPFVGSVDVLEKSPEELDRELTTGLGTYFRNIEIAVNIKDPAQRSVYVIGEVRNPGRFEFAYGDRVIHALGRAGGMEDRARETGIVLVRREPDGEDHAYRLDFGSLHEFTTPGDVYLQPGDVVFVPKSRFATFTEFATSFFDVVNKVLTSAVLGNDLRLRERSISISNR